MWCAVTEVCTRLRIVAVSHHVPAVRDVELSAGLRGELVVAAACVESVLVHVPCLEGA